MFSFSGRIRYSSDPLDFSRLRQLDGFQVFSYRTGEMHLATPAGSHAPLQHLKHTQRTIQKQTHVHFKKRTDVLYTSVIPLFLNHLHQCQNSS